MLHLTILQYNTRITDICFPKRTLMCILRCHEHLWYICETTFEQLPYHTLKICSNLKCGNNFFQYATSRMSPFHDFKILVNEMFNLRNFSPSLFQFLIFDNSLSPIFNLLALSLWIGVLCWHYCRCGCTETFRLSLLTPRKVSPSSSSSSSYSSSYSSLSFSSSSSSFFSFLCSRPEVLTQ